MELDYQIAYRSGIPLIYLRGRFDAEAASFVKVQLLSLVNEQQPNMVVNMQGVNFVDSLGLVALVSGMKLCRKNRGVFRLVGLQPTVRFLFEMTRLDQAFELFPTDEDAFADFARG